MNYLTNKVLIGITLMFFFSCGLDSVDINEPFQTSKEFKNKPVEVKTTLLKLNTFYRELIVNGKLFASKSVDLQFKLQEPLESILVNNGDYVNKNQIIATQQQFTLKNNLAKAQEGLTKAKIELENILLEYKYTLTDSLKIPKHIFEVAKNKANYTTAQLNLNNAQYELSTSVLRAPFSGVIANLNSNNYNYPDNIKPFCTIIDNSIFEVVFKVLEIDNFFIHNNQLLEIFISGDTSIYNGSINEINPLVDENSMITIKGRLKETSKNLLDGMNATVKIKKAIEEVLYIPKEAVVLRDNKKVVFTYKNGLALWNYVETGFENDKYVIIISGLKSNDQVIYEGNLSLAHKSKVVID